MGQGALMLGAGAGNSSGDNLAPFGDKIFQHFLIFVIDLDLAVGAKTTYFSAMENASLFLHVRVACFSMIGCHLSTPWWFLLSQGFLLLGPGSLLRVPVQVQSLLLQPQGQLLQLFLLQLPPQASLQ